MTEQRKTPIVVITGFLGAGKTTLVNHILTAQHGKKIAVIENEFGEVGIDDDLVTNALETREEIFEMNNGCVCCTVRGDLIRILNKLLKRKTKFDAIMIETTGLANPAPVIQTFFVDDDIKEGCALDAVLTVVDAKHVTQHLDDKKPEGVVNEAVQQIAFADKILLNKLDLVTDVEKELVIKRIRGINKQVEVIECTRSNVDLDRIFGIYAFDLEKLLTQDPHFLDDAPHDDHYGHKHDHDHHHDHDHGHDHHHDHDHKCDESCKHHHVHAHEHEEHHHHLDHKHDDGVTSVGITMEGDIDMHKLNDWLSNLLRERGPDLFRSKGIFSLAGTDDKHVFQGVHMLLQFSSSADGVGRPWQPGEKRVNKVVFIGRNLNRQELTDSLRACLVTK